MPKYKEFDGTLKSMGGYPTVEFSMRAAKNFW